MNCAICDQPIEALPCVAFRNRHTKGYPTEPIFTEVVPMHGRCDDTRWYVMGGAWMTLEEVEANIRHLSQKKWFGALTADSFRKLARKVIEDQIARRFASLSAAGERSNARHIAPAIRARVMERDDFKCRRCGCGPTDRALVVDHVYPVKRGGSRDLANLQTLCVACNAGKGVRPPHPHDLEVVR